MKLLYNCAITIGVIAFLTNCGGSSSPDVLGLALLAPVPKSAESAPQGIGFQAVVGDSVAACATEITGHGEVHSSSTVNALHVAGVMPIVLKDLRFYVSEFELVDQDDRIVTVDVPDTGVWQYSGITLLDFENASGGCTGTEATNKIVQTVLENKSYKTIRFTVGVPENLNHIDYSNAPSPMNVSGMAWGWTMGYRFFVGEFRSGDSATFGNSAVLHIGSAGCSEPTGGNYSCTNSNRARIELTPTGGFNPFTQNVQFDFKKAVAGWDISTGSKTCHSMGSMDSSCAAVYSNFGLDYNTGNTGSATQTVFNVVSK